MADVQTEHGHIRIASDLYRVALQRLKPTHYKTWATILDLTYNRRLKEAELKYSDIAATARMSERDVIRHCQALEQSFVIFIHRQKGRTNIIGPNKDYDQWSGDNLLTGDESVTPTNSVTPRVTNLSPHGCQNCHPTGDESVTPPPYKSTTMSSTNHHPCDDDDRPVDDTDIPSGATPEQIEQIERRAALDSKVPLLQLLKRYRRRALPLAGKRHWTPSQNDHETSEQLMSRPDWDRDLAIRAMQLCHKTASASGSRPGSLNYYAKAIVEALATGELPRARKGAGASSKRLSIAQ